MAVLLWQDIAIEIFLLRLYQACVTLVHSVHPGHSAYALWPWTVDAATLWHKLALPLGP